MKYAIIFPPQGNLHHATKDHLDDGKQRLQKALDDKTIEAAYSKVGGGGIWIVNSESNHTLIKGLRKHLITNVEVIPIVDTVDVLDGHLEYHAAGTHPEWVETHVKSSYK